MDAPTNLPEETGSDAASGDAPALIVCNGRHSGERRALVAPLTLVGRAPAADLQLNSRGVAGVHCALLEQAEGWVLRDLGGGTRVNDVAVELCRLCDGDVITVGPFEFGFHPGRRSSPHPLSTEELGLLGALRIQAAAVAAQQAALLEEESRLQQRKQTFECQEQQLALHLEERRQQLLDLQEQIRQARLDWEQEKEQAEQQINTLRADLLREQEEARTATEQAQGERQRLAELHRRMRRRWKERWGKEQELLQARETELNRESERLARERNNLDQARLRFNGEVELGRRQLHDGWEQLRQARQGWDETREREQLALHLRRREMEQRVSLITQAERTLQTQQREAHATRGRLEKEAEGLEQRIRNLRNKLAETQPPLAESAARPATEPRTAPLAPMLVPAQELLGSLDDQRLQLAEQCGRFVQLVQEWQQDRESVVLDFEQTADALRFREQQIEEEERRLEQLAGDLRLRQVDLTQLRLHLEGWQARLHQRDIEAAAERDLLLVQVRAREEQATELSQQLALLRERWSERRRQEKTRLQGELACFQEMRRQYSALWEEYQRRDDELSQNLRSVAERSLALEQLQQELVGRSENSAGLEKRLERLRGQHATLFAEVDQRLSRERQSLETEAARLDELAKRQHHQTEVLLVRETDLSARQTAWEHQHLLGEHATAQRERELQTLRMITQTQERQLAELRDEVERLVRILFDETDAPIVRVGHAAA
jgi:pSer/pThr/pTyr-binding forkhead associated (FHA) protein